MSLDQIETVVESFKSKAGKGRKSYLLSTMFRIHCVQHWYNTSDLAMEDTFYEITHHAFFSRLLLDSAISDHTSIMNFRHLLEKHQLSRHLFKEVNQWSYSAGIYFK